MGWSSVRGFETLLSMGGLVIRGRADTPLHSVVKRMIPMEDLFSSLSPQMGQQRKLSHWIQQPLEIGNRLAKLSLEDHYGNPHRILQHYK